jgi:hypothetical protein
VSCYGCWGKLSSSRKECPLIFKKTLEKQDFASHLPSNTVWLWSPASMGTCKVDHLHAYHILYIQINVVYHISSIYTYIYVYIISICRSYIHVHTHTYIYIPIPTSKTNPSHSSISSKSANRKLMLVITVSTHPCWSLLGVQKTLARMESAWDSTPGSGIGLPLCLSISFTVHMQIYLNNSIYIYIGHVYMYISIYLYMYICMYVYMYICMYMYICKYVSM